MMILVGYTVNPPCDCSVIYFQFGKGPSKTLIILRGATSYINSNHLSYVAEIDYIDRWIDVHTLYPIDNFLGTDLLTASFKFKYEKGRLVHLLSFAF